MKQRFKVRSQIAFEQLESELNKLGYTWSSGKVKYARELMRKYGNKLPLVVYVYTYGKHITYGSVEDCMEEIDATFEIGMNLFQDTDGSVHIVQVSKPLETKELRYRFVPVTLDDALANSENTYYEDDGYDGLLRLYKDTRFTIEELTKTKFYKREEF